MAGMMGMGYVPLAQDGSLSGVSRRFEQRKMVELARERHKRLTTMQRTVSQSGIWVSVIVGAVVCFLLYTFVFTGNEKMFWVLLFAFLIWVGYNFLQGPGRSPQTMAAFI